MKITRNIFLWLSGILLFLHSFVPHEHHSELDEKEHIAQHQNATSFLDYLKLAFHENPGENHLEDYQVNHVNFIFLLPGYITSNFQIHYTTKVSGSTLYVEHYRALNHSSYHTLRGPPVTG